MTARPNDNADYKREWLRERRRVFKAASDALADALAKGELLPPGPQSSYGSFRLPDAKRGYDFDPFTGKFTR